MVKKLCGSCFHKGQYHPIILCSWLCSPFWHPLSNSPLCPWCRHFLKTWLSYHLIQLPFFPINFECPTCPPKLACCSKEAKSELSPVLYWSRIESSCFWDKLSFVDQDEVVSWLWHAREEMRSNCIYLWCHCLSAHILCAALLTKLVSAGGLS